MFCFVYRKFVIELRELEIGCLCVCVEVLLRVIMYSIYFVRNKNQDISKENYIVIYVAKSV